jgi:uncharacterized protein
MMAMLAVSTLELVRDNLLSPMVLAFALGLFAQLVRSDLRLPPALYTTLSIYLLFAIGLKGGVALAETRLADLWPSLIATVVLGIATPLIAYAAARFLGRLDTPDAAALAAHYGSVSAVTFIAALTFAQRKFPQTEGFLPALVAVLELPAILVATLIAKRKGRAGSLKPIMHELVTGKTIILLAGGLMIGAISGTKGVEQVTPLFGDLFKGALTIFLLEMGLLAGEQLHALRQRALFLVSFGTLLPIVNGVLGVIAGTYAGLSPGGAGVLGAMVGSASYIAAPAAVRIAIPEANPTIFLTAALGITFPFNLTIGIPLYLEIAARFATP